MKNLKRFLPFTCAFLILVGVAFYSLSSLISKQNQAKSLNTASIGLIPENFSIKLHVRSLNVKSMNNCVYDLKLNGTSMDLREFSENGRSFYLDNLNDSDLIYVSGTITGTVDGLLTTVDVEHAFPLSRTSFEIKKNIETTILAHDLFVHCSVRVR